MDAIKDHFSRSSANRGDVQYELGVIRRLRKILENLVANDKKYNQAELQECYLSIVNILRDGSRYGEPKFNVTLPYCEPCPCRCVTMKIGDYPKALIDPLDLYSCMAPYNTREKLYQLYFKDRDSDPSEPTGKLYSIYEASAADPVPPEQIPSASRTTVTEASAADPVRPEQTPSASRTTASEETAAAAERRKIVFFYKEQIASKLAELHSYVAALVRPNQGISQSAPGIPQLISETPIRQYQNHARFRPDIVLLIQVREYIKEVELFLSRYKTALGQQTSIPDIDSFITGDFKRLKDYLYYILEDEVTRNTNKQYLIVERCLSGLEDAIAYKSSSLKIFFFGRWDVFFKIVCPGFLVAAILIVCLPLALDALKKHT